MTCRDNATQEWTGIVRELIEVNRRIISPNNQYFCMISDKNTDYFIEYLLVINKIKNMEDENNFLYMFI